jgi:hypothetical protein
VALECCCRRAPSLQPVLSQRRTLVNLSWMVSCPAGLHVVDQDHPPKRTTLGNFSSNPDPCPRRFPRARARLRLFPCQIFAGTSQSGSTRRNIWFRTTGRQENLSTTGLRDKFPVAASRRPSARYARRTSLHFHDLGRATDDCAGFSRTRVRQALLRQPGHFPKTKRIRLSST